MRRFLAAVFVMAAAASGFAGAALAQVAEPYPTKVIRIVVPLAAGGVTDTVARALAEKLSQAWGQPVIVDNRPGAGGGTAAEAVAKSPADGYTLLMGTVSSHAINATLYSNLRYDNIKDFAPISLVASGPNMLAVHPSVPAQNVAELVKVLKDNPGKYSYGSAGVGTSTQLLAELFKKKTGTDITHVPYKGSAPMIVDLLSGVVQLAFDNMPTALAQVQNGKLRALAVTGEQRWPGLPDLPTVAETVPGVTGTSWQGLFAPAGVPEPILDKLSAEVQKILSDPAMVSRFQELGTRAGGSTRAEFAAFVKSETERWGEMVKAAGAQLE